MPSRKSSKNTTKPTRSVRSTKSTKKTSSSLISRFTAKLPTSRRKRTALLFVTLFALIGTLVLFRSFASTANQTEPETWTISGSNVTKTLAQSTSPGYLQFDAPVSTSGGLKGWELTTSNVGLAPHGLSCNSLPVYTGPLKPQAGARISNVRITGNIDLSNGDIIIEKSCIKPTSGNDRAVVSNDVCGSNECVVTSPASVTIRDSEINASELPASSIARSCAFRGVGTLQRNYMHGMGTGICFFGTGFVHDAIAERNYITGLRSFGDSHNEAATIRDFRKNQNNTRWARFIANRMDASSGNVTAGLFVQPTWVDIHNVLVQDNYIEGEGFNLYIENKGGVYGNLQAINNRFRSTGWGPSTVSSGVGWATWRDNFRYDASKPDAKGAVVNP